ncbi:transcription factor ETV6-like isoform X2 [Gigantopelta aegis]|uniref:transcription factor ETV6-like isoform X2 n=1 Tax=Gigantopelta aegis TaxID=1735272 RepID=UPI001B88B7F2|nr:transcription factor ETV6-like isoform X2 [Gigantopelta aegis]
MKRRTIYLATLTARRRPACSACFLSFLKASDDRVFCFVFLLARHPHAWTKEEVKIWLRWCADEYSIDPVCPGTFDMNGKALDLLTKKDFIDRAPKSGDVLFNALQRHLKRHSATVLNAPHFPSYKLENHDPSNNRSQLRHPSPANLNSRPNDVLQVSTSSASFINTTAVKSEQPFVPILPWPRPPATPSADRQCSPCVPQAVPESVLTPASTSPDSNSTVSDADSIQTDDMTIDLGEADKEKECQSALINHQDSVKKEDGDCRLLWEFIHQLLIDSKYKSYVVWENEADLTFRILNPTELAKLWGLQKNRTNMTYEKLSRALRYYYKMNIIKKVPGRRLTYMFLQHPRSIKKGQRGAKPHIIRDASVKAQYLLPTDIKPSSETNVCALSFGDTQCLQNDRNPFPGPHSPLPSPQNWEPNLLGNAMRRSRDSGDQSCDLQFINGRLTTVDSSPSSVHERIRLDSIKHEFPVQNEPEDLSMKNALKRPHSRNSVFGTRTGLDNETYEMDLYDGYEGDLLDSKHKLREVVDNKQGASSDM